MTGVCPVDTDIHPYVPSDILLCHKVVPLYKWIEVVCGVSQDRLITWMSQISQGRWFADEAIEAALADYCGTKELGRCDPFVSIANRVLLLARGTLAGVPAENSYPINDVTFANHSSRPVQEIPEHGNVGAQRCPDVVCVRQSVAERMASDSSARASWSEILYWCEIKYNHLLIDMLREERLERGMTTLRADGQPVKRSKPAGNTNRRAKTSRAKNSRKVPTSSHTSIVDPDAEVRAGQKRKLDDRTDTDLLCGRKFDSYLKGVYGSGPGCEELDGWKAVVQSGAYALELLSGSFGTRTHCFGLVMTDDRIYPWFYDSTGIVYCTQFASLVCDFELAAALIVALATCTPSKVGFLPESIFQPPTPYPTNFPVPHLGGFKVPMKDETSGMETKITLRDSLFTAYTLVGRRTFLYTADTSPQISKHPVAVKFSYQASSRAKEQDMVARARRAGVKHLPTIHMSADLWKLSDGIRDVFYEASEHTASYEDLTLRAIVYTRYASIEPLFAQRCELIPVMVDQMLDCLHDLRYKANLLHRDISINNIMYEMRGDKYYFVLIDFDMAVEVTDDEDGTSSYLASSAHRTGTLPFMAFELVADACRAVRFDGEAPWKPIRHLLSHDFESLYWVSVWCILVVVTEGLSARQKNVLRDRAALYGSGKLELVCSQKRRDFELMLGRHGLTVSPAAEPLIPWLTTWSLILNEARRLSFERSVGVCLGILASDATSPEELLTRDNLKAKLSEYAPFIQEVDGLEADFPASGDEIEGTNTLDEVIRVPEDALLATKDFALGDPSKSVTDPEDKDAPKSTASKAKTRAAKSKAKAVHIKDEAKPSPAVQGEMVPKAGDGPLPSEATPVPSTSKGKAAAEKASEEEEEEEKEEAEEEEEEEEAEEEEKEEKAAAAADNAEEKNKAPVAKKVALKRRKRAKVAPAIPPENSMRSRLRPRKVIHYF